jgi:hypothetical protein
MGSLPDSEGEPMRLLLTAATLSAIALPAAAQSRAEDAVRALNDPIVQEGAALAASMLAGIVLDTHVGVLSHYDPSIRPGDTLRDVQRRTDPGFEDKLRDGTRRAVAAAGAVAQDGVAIAGELASTADRLRDALAPLSAAIDAYQN